jgi:transcriptional regulator of acetoin/glycerol metabolism
MARGTSISLRDLPAALVQGSADPQSLSADREGVLRGADRQYLEQLLRANQGNVARSAQQAGLSRQGLHKLLKKHGVEPVLFRR